MSFDQISTSRIGAEAACPACEAGRLIRFNWRYHGKQGSPDQRRRLDAFEPWQALRHGSLYRCTACARPWHLDGAGEMMTIVPDGRLDLILAWSRAEIMLADDALEALGEIGPTPPDVYGNGGDHVEIPCGVVTRSGERIDAAIVSIQRDAPVEEWRVSRLASEIASVYPSPLALPLDVRLATTRADELRMGFAPTLIAMPDGRRFMLNWTANFIAEPGYRAADARYCGDPIDIRQLPDLAAAPPITYFVADG